MAWQSQVMVLKYAFPRLMNSKYLSNCMHLASSSLDLYPTTPIHFTAAYFNLINIFVTDWKSMLKPVLATIHMHLKAL